MALPWVVDRTCSFSALVTISGAQLQNCVSSLKSIVWRSYGTGMADNGDGHSNGQPADVVASLSDEERERAGLAQSAFEAGSYDTCLEHLTYLQDLRPKDHKVQHNIAVAQYYRSKLTETDDFIKALTSLKTQVRTLYHSSKGLGSTRRFGDVLIVQRIVTPSSSTRRIFSSLLEVYTRLLFV